MRRDRVEISPPDAQSEPGFVSHQVSRFQRNPEHREKFDRSIEDDDISQEVPVALSYNGIAHAVMMATPLDLEDYALGFSLSEGIVDSPQQLYDLERNDRTDGITLELNIASSCMARLSEHRRTLTGRTGCGVCGTESLMMLNLSAAKVGAPIKIEPEALLNAFTKLQAQQTINARTGAVHAAAWASTNGELVCVREDVGRHNALDKLIGALSRQANLRVPGFCLLTSRASYELVQRAARAQMSLVAAISAPTSLAIKMAQQAGMTLIGFARRDGFVVYTQAQDFDSPSLSTPADRSS